MTCCLCSERGGSNEIRKGTHTANKQANHIVLIAAPLFLSLWHCVLAPWISLFLYDWHLHLMQMSVIKCCIDISHLLLIEIKF